ncbi:MAG: hypothetical protein H0W64_03845 [Gammaproteobacteria bacterium]|nr:hypothetical protein [Gammaproteobacteria bacterium]
MNLLNQFAACRGRSLENRSILILFTLCCFYCFFAFFFNEYARLSPDEFWFAHAQVQFKFGLPYRDFAPYKTVLGYYLLNLMSLSAEPTFATLMLIKHGLAMINTIVLFFGALWLMRFFKSIAVLLSLGLLMSSELFLNYATNIRVDLFGFWFCFFAVMLLFEQRYLLSGVLIGIGFTITQKVIWYLFAGNITLLFLFLHHRSAFSFNAIFKFNIGTAFVILSYLIIWCWLADFNTVVQSVFFEASAMYHLAWYAGARYLFWSHIIYFNPILFLLLPVTLISLFVTFKMDSAYRYRFIAISMMFSILVCLIPYNQIFPYYMQVAFPVFFISYAAFFDWLFAVVAEQQKNLFFLTQKTWVTSTLLLSNLLMIVLLIFFKIPLFYFLLLSLPVILYFVFRPSKILNTALIKVRYFILSIPILFVGFIYPLIIFTQQALRQTGQYQRAHIFAAEALLKDKTDYIAGVDLLPSRSQPINGLKHLMGPAIDFLYQPTPSLRAVMLPSLDQDQLATVDSIKDAIATSQVKFYINNYRMMALPPHLKIYLQANYQHFWGSIYLYAPQFSPQNSDIFIKFSGKYRIDSYRDVYLNGMQLTNGETTYLSQGHYRANSKGDYRLVLIPTIENRYLLKKFSHDQWQLII